MRPALGLTLALLTACSAPPPPAAPGGPLVVAFTADAAPRVRVEGWSTAELDSLTRAGWTDEWTGLVHVSVGGSSGLAMAGRYDVTGDAVEFTPAFPLEPGRPYHVTVDAGRLPHPRPGSRTVITTLTLPMPVEAPAVHVARIFPSANVWPENTLRFYLHFSGPMSGTSAVDHVRLVDADGVTIPDVLLDIDVDLWDTTYTRRTVFFDPGRVKQDIRPNRELGRALIAGRRYAIIVSAAWKDARGRPMAGDFRHEFEAGPAVTTGIEPDDWVITQPRTGSRDALTITFTRALDEGLLHRAVGITAADGQAIDGVASIGPGERTWTFTPVRPWPASPAQLVVLSLLEDPQGNTVREAFEFEMFGRPAPAAPERLTYPLVLRK